MTRLARLAAGFRNAFSLGPPGPAVPTPEEREVIDRILAVVVRREMAGPAILFLESSRPLSGVAAASIHYFAPFASALVDSSALAHLASFLDRRGSVEWLCRRLEELEADARPSEPPDVMASPESTRYRATETEPTERSVPPS